MADRASEIESISASIGRTIEAQTDRTAQALYALLRDLSKQVEDSSGRDVVQISLNLAKHDEHVLRFAACALIFHHRDALERLTLKAVEQLGRGIGSWGDVDVFAGYLSGPAWRVGRLKDSHIHRWARSKDRWWRRTALVSTVALNRKSFGGTGDVRRTLDVCRILVSDADDMVVKALSWALRELIRHDANAVRRFLVTHEGALARRVVREVNNKLETGVKNPACRGSRRWRVPCPDSNGRRTRTMEEPMFPDKSHMPQDADLARVLGRTKRHWDNLRAHALDADPAATPEWKFYSQKSGWTFLLRGKRRNVLYMRPTAKHRFTVSFVFGKKAVQAAEQSDLPDHVIDMIRQAPQYPEGRMVHVEVTTAADVKIATRLLAIKMDN